jgi:hypothetical protein
MELGKAFALFSKKKKKKATSMVGWMRNQKQEL